MAVRPICKVLVANRGEIAVRIMRACRELGIRTVALYSDPDRDALHTMMADEAFPLNGNESLNTYLLPDKIFDIAHRAKVDAIHPGFGFLSEKAHFSRRCREEGIIFIGPPPESIELMGDKAAARKAMIAAGVPVTPGSEGILTTREEVEAVAAKVGFPLLIKASAGGGGRGMRVVNSAADIVDALESAQREASTAFNDPSVYVEKYVANPKHIEFQLMVDQYGHGVYLLERECSFQRKHQKVIEECPSPSMTQEARERLGNIALKAAAACGYVNAGTIEFLFEDLDHIYFMEMNTRIQVEHPVTELVTGVDLIHWQLRVAAGEHLTLKQEDIRPRGWAIECRINAEDPANGFLPSPGMIHALKEPGGPGIRVDSGVREGYTIPQYYDSMIAKVIAHAPSREAAIARMKRALHEFQILGPVTNIPLHLLLLDTAAFHDGSYTVKYIESHLAELTASLNQQDETELAIAAAVAKLLQLEQAAPPAQQRGQQVSAWKLRARSEATGGW